MSSDTLAPGLMLNGRYRLIRPLGQGGMGAVWEAENDRRQSVAVKMLAAGLELDRGLLERFRLEASTANAIGHPGVVRVIDTGATPWGTPFLVMERLVGLTVGDFAQRHGQLKLPQASAVVVPLLDALSATHAAGVVHRDLKPANVFINLEPSPAIKLLDFGVSKLATREALTGTGLAFGTPAYMAPEQIADTRSAGPAADVYAVGAILYELLAGRPLFEGDNPLSIAAKVASAGAPSFAAAGTKAPPALVALIDSALSRDPAARPASAAAFRDALAQLAPPDSNWLFAAAFQQVREANAPAEPNRSLPPTASPRRPPVRGNEISAALVLARLGVPLTPLAAVRAVREVLLDPEAPSVVHAATLLLGDNGSVRATPGAPKVATHGARVRSTTPVEAWSGSRTPATLQFSLGAVLFELLSGRALFEGADEVSVKQTLQASRVPPLGAGVPAALHSVIAQMVNADPAQRFATGGDCVNALEACFVGGFDAGLAQLELGAAVRNVSHAGTRAAPSVSDLRPAAGEGGLGQAARLLLAVIVAAGLAGAVVVWRLKAMIAAQPKDTTVEFVSPFGDPNAKHDAQYEIETVPSGASLLINGEPKGTSPGVLTLAPDISWRLEVRLAGYTSRVIDVIPASGAKEKLSLTLERE